MNAPKPPIAPRPPASPKTTHKIDISMSFYGDISLKDVAYELEQKYPGLSVDLSKVKIGSIGHDYDGCFEDITFVYEDEEAFKRIFEEQLKYHEVVLERYRQNYKEYLEKMEIYKKDLKDYKIWEARQTLKEYGGPPF